MRQFIDSCHRLAVVRCHDSGIGTFAKIVYADILVFIQIEESDYITVFAQLIVRFLYLLAQIGRFIAVFGSRGFGKTAVGCGDFHCEVMDVMRAAIDGSHAHHSGFIYLKAQVRAVQVLFYYL